MSAPGRGFWLGLRPQISIREVFLFLLPWRGKPNSRVISRHLSKGFSAFACRLTPLLDAGRSKGRELAIASDPDRQAGFSVAKSTSPCWLVTVTFLPLPLLCCCTPEMR